MSSPGLVEQLRDVLTRARTDAVKPDARSLSTDALYEDWAEWLNAMERTASQDAELPSEELERVLRSFQAELAELPAAVRRAHEEYESSHPLKLSDKVTPKGRECLALCLGGQVDELIGRLRFLAAKRRNAERCDCRLLIEFEQNQRPQTDQWRLVDAGSAGSYEWSRHECGACGRVWQEESDLGSTAWFVGAAASRGEPRKE